jgi:PEP-CTERM motif
MLKTYSRPSKNSRSHSTVTASLGALAWLLLTLLPAQLANAQGTIIFDNHIPAGTGIGQTTHVWGPSSTVPTVSLIGLGSNDSPSGTTPFGSASGMTLIGVGGTGGQYGGATTFAQLIGAVGLNAPESSLVPLGQTTTFRTGAAAGFIAAIVDTLQGILAGAVATLEIVAWDNSSGLFPTWTQASVAWWAGLIAAGHSAPFTTTVNGGYLNNQDSVNQTSFNLVPSIPEPSTCALAGLGAIALLAWRQRRK